MSISIFSDVWAFLQTSLIVGVLLFLVTLAGLWGYKRFSAWRSAQRHLALVEHGFHKRTGSQNSETEIKGLYKLNA